MCPEQRRRRPNTQVMHPIHTDAPDCPPLGLALPAEFVRTRDADTLEWRVPGSAFVFASRLIDVWAPETDSTDPADKERAIAGKLFVTQQCQAAKFLTIQIPLPDSRQPLKFLTFDRLPSWVWLDTKVLLNRLIVKAGYAASYKHGRRGA